MRKIQRTFTEKKHHACLHTDNVIIGSTPYVHRSTSAPEYILHYIRATGVALHLQLHARQSDKLFTARCYASALIAWPWACVRLSFTSRCSVEVAERIELVLARELPSTSPTLC